MADQRNGGIAWTDETWNPLRGCSRVSEGCRNCYAESMAGRFCGPGMAFEGVAKRVNGKGQWTGEVHLIGERLFDPLRWKRPRMVFVNSVSDPFHESVTDEMRDKIFAVMWLCEATGKGHVFQILTKRPKRAQEYISNLKGRALKFSTMAVNMTLPGDKMWSDPDPIADFICDGVATGALPNLWLGVSVENQAAADERIPRLLETPAAVRFISAEPLLGPVEWRKWLPTGRHAQSLDGTIFIAAHFYMMVCEKCGWVGSTEFCSGGDEDVICPSCHRSVLAEELPTLDWAICGGESGPQARPMHPDWARSLRDQCKASGVPFLFKQCGEFAHADDLPSEMQEHYDCIGKTDGEFVRVGKRAAGRRLDGVEHNGFPEVQS